MSDCAKCNAALPADAESCPYCGLATPLVVERQRAAEQAEREAKARADQEARTREDAALQKSAKTAFYWSLMGFVAWCLGIPSVVGLVLGMRTRGRAHRAGAATPGYATVAVVLGTIGTVIFGLLVIIGIRQVRMDFARRTELMAAIETGARAEKLETAAACALVELQLRTHGVGGHTRQQIPECPVIAQAGETASLTGIRVPANGTTPSLDLTGCLRRESGTWRVVELRTEGPCAF
jgi:hypothetical protein